MSSEYIRFVLSVVVFLPLLALVLLFYIGRK